MSDYRVDVTEYAAALIQRYAENIEEVSGSWRTADRWLDAVYDEINTLRYMPNRYEPAEEGKGRSYEVRRLVIGDYLALYHLDESGRIVSILSFRHGSRLPRHSDLPEDPPA